MEAFRNIGEVSDELGVRKHVLRFWEAKFPQLKPMKRGGGRRYYRPADVQLLRGIRHLLQTAGYTIKGVQKILREEGVEAVKAAIRAAHPARPTTDTPPCANPAGAPAMVGKKLGMLGPAEVHALRAVVAELDACRPCSVASDVVRHRNAAVAARGTARLNPGTLRAGCRERTPACP